MREDDIKFCVKCRDDDDVLRFYNDSRWKHKRKEVLLLDRGECQVCKSRGIITTANTIIDGHRARMTVHHVNEFRKMPEHALDVYVNGERNLITVCDKCHEEIHRRFGNKKKKQEINNERWD